MKENQKYRIDEGAKCQIAGWALFVICAIFYIASSLKNHDMLSFIGGVIFLVACILFLIPVVSACKTAEADIEKNDE